MGRDLADSSLFSFKAYLKQAEKPIVLNFFWVECKPCRKELPHLAQLEQQYGDKAQFLAVHSGLRTKTGMNYNQQQVQKFIDSLPALTSVAEPQAQKSQKQERDQTQTIKVRKAYKAPQKIIWAGDKVRSEKWNIPAFPSTIIIESGKIVQVLLGYTKKTQKQLEHYLQQL